MVKIRKRLTKGDITKIILETVKASTLISTALVAPGVLVAMKKLGITFGKEKLKVITNARLRLIKDGYLRKNKKGFLELSDKGEERLRFYELKEYELVISRIWDKKWRMLVFDIPETRRYTRQKVRNTLRSIGFYRLQDSVWVYPYDCAELISLLKADFKIGKDLLYLIVQEIENDRKVKEYFNLK